MLDKKNAIRVDFSYPKHKNAGGRKRLYIFKCKICIVNEIRVRSGELKIRSGNCKKCADLIKLQKARVECSKIDRTLYKFSKVTFKYCKYCEKAFRANKNDCRILFCSSTCTKEFHRTPNEVTNKIGRRYSRSKAACTRAKVRDNPKRKFNITLDEFSEIFKNGKCYYCGGTIGYSGVGLDRIDNDLPYNKDNVLPCCGNCNKLRSDKLSVTETEKVIRLLKKLRGGVVWPNYE